LRNKCVLFFYSQFCQTHKIGIPACEAVSQLLFLSFRVSESRHGIHENQLVMDTGLRRYDDFYCGLCYCHTVSAREWQKNDLWLFTSSSILFTNFQ